jgi:nitrate reductase (NAD(P)H)
MAPRHPLNAEPPLPVLMSKGFITPTALHYVRNHGAVPQLDWDAHRVSVGGMVDRPASYSIPELLALLPSYTIPITLVCAGAGAMHRTILIYLAPAGLE